MGDGGTLRAPGHLLARASAGAAPALLAAGWLLALFGRLLSPDRALANRDIGLFHLPLRAALRWLVEQGAPGWNPLVHGGQPVLSNPSYAAFYPPSWLGLAITPAYALNLVVLLHAGIAFAGAWRLARRLGCGRSAAALAALGYSGSGAILSLISALTLFCSMAWLPWVLAFGDAALRAEGKRAWLRSGSAAGLALAAQLLNGEPVTVVVSGLGLAALALAAAARRPLTALRLAVPLAIALALAAAQLLPTRARLADSPRAGKLGARQATTWSAPPQRVVELVYPRWFGDPSRIQENLYFGWKLHDNDYPYVLSFYPGLLLTVLGFAALCRWPVPRRGAWALAAGIGVFLALGRYNPLYEALRGAVPLLGILRYPEKFALLTLSALAFAGALGWQHLLAERQAGRRDGADFPLALAAVLFTVAAALTALLWARPPLAEWFVRTHGTPGASPASVARGALYLRQQGLAAIATTGAVAALLALCRWGRPPRWALALLAPALLAADLWHHGHELVLTAPASWFREPPPAAHLLAGRKERIFVEPPPEDGTPDLVPAGSDIALSLVRVQLDRLDPYSGALWGLAYALHPDYDLMMTGWARRALELYEIERERPDLLYPLLGSWNVGTIFARRDPEEWIVEAVRRGRALPLRPVPNPYVLPRYRFVPRVSFHASHPSAVGGARAEHYALDRHEHCVRPGGEPATVDYPGRPALLGVAERGGRIDLRYRSAGPAFLTVAMTYDEGWRATAGGAPLPTWPTAVGQLGVELPAGAHRLVLEYRDGWVGVGLAVSLAALAGLGALLFVLRE